MSASLLSKAVCAAALTTVLGAAAANAATIAALKDGKTIVWIDTAQMKVTGSVNLAGGASLAGFDVRPSDGKLYGLTTGGDIVTIDAKTGTWEAKSKLSEMLPAGATVSVDFNPVADRLRVITSTGTSLRVNVEDGKAVVDGSLKYADMDPNKGKQPNVVAVAYSNSFAGTKETALYDIDAMSGMFLKQAPPNDGIVSGIGKLGVKMDGPVAFDIAADGMGGNTGWLLAGGTLYSVDIASGATRQAGKIAGLSGKVTDIAVLPGM
jgi:hypothetical protein